MSFFLAYELTQLLSLMIYAVKVRPRLAINETPNRSVEGRSCMPLCFQQDPYVFAPAVATTVTGPQPTWARQVHSMEQEKVFVT